MGIPLTIVAASDFVRSARDVAASHGASTRRCRDRVRALLTDARDPLGPLIHGWIPGQVQPRVGSGRALCRVASATSDSVVVLEYVANPTWQWDGIHVVSLQAFHSFGQIDAQKATSDFFPLITALKFLMAPSGNLTPRGIKRCMSLLDQSSDPVMMAIARSWDQRLGGGRIRKDAALVAFEHARAASGEVGVVELVSKGRWLVDGVRLATRAEHEAFGEPDQGPGGAYY